MTDIDFLPAGYHRHREQRLRRRWHRLVSLVFAGLVITGTIGQWSRVSRERARLWQLQASVATALAAIPDATPLKIELERLIEHDRTSQILEQDHSLASILEEVSRLRPQGVSLTELHWQNSVSGASDSRNSTLSQPSSQRLVAPWASGELLKRTLSELAHRQPTLQLTGLAPDHLKMADYLNALETSSHFTEARLELSTALKQNDLELQQFQIVLKLRPLGQLEPVTQHQPVEKHRVREAQPVEQTSPDPKPDFSNEHEIATDIVPQKTAEQPPSNHSTKN